MAEAETIEETNVVAIEEFARDMMEFVGNAYLTGPRRVANCYSPFKPEMGKTVLRFMLYFEYFLLQISMIVTKEVEENKMTLEEFAEILTDNAAKDFPFLELIFICGIIGRISIDHYKMRNMNTACKLIGFCFEHFKEKFEAEGGWPNFELYCQMYGTALSKLIGNRRTPHDVL
ncbi:hypothetical protein AVEN_100863-1 [Araneus ventricosus]|uniref:Uncharacterized protein n=1 Tax=Araneus ventricosus TaxID=182803 RepID=A0A4Y2AXK4_ARAVE|nr:hypothetical protein AVEN_100863-1 [Araneus ventricosus]